jgi:hypothetical protein
VIAERIRAALADLHERWRGRRRPKAIYLAPPDWEEFLATDPPKGRFAFGNNPTVWRDEPTFDGVPVRPSKSGLSRLYDETTTGRVIN